MWPNHYIFKSKNIPSGIILFVMKNKTLQLIILYNNFMRQ